MKFVRTLLFHLTITLFLSMIVLIVQAQDKKLTKLLMTGDLQKAESYCFKQTGEKRSSCYNTLGDHAFSKGDYDKADKYYFWTDDKVGYLKIAEHYYNNSKWSEAIIYYVRTKAYTANFEKSNEYEHYLVAQSKLAAAKVKSIPPKLIYEDYASELDFAVFSPDSKYILSGGRIDANIGGYPIHLWDLELGKMIRSYGEGDKRVLKASFTPDGKYILARGRGLKLIDFKSGNVVWGKQGMFYSSAISADGKYVVSGSNSIVTLIETKSGNTIKTFEANRGRYIQSVNFSPDGRYIATSSYKDEERAIRIWDVEIGMLYRTLEGHLKDVTQVVFSPDSKYVLSGSWDKTLKLWDIESGQEIRTYRNKDGGSIDPTNFDFSPSGKSIIVKTNSFAPYIIEIDVETGEKSIIKKFLETSDWLSSISFSPNGKFILAAYQRKKRLELFDVKTGNELPTMISFNNYNDWLLTTNDGRFDGSKGAMDKIYYEVNGDFLPLESFYERYFTPNLFSRIIDGEKFLKRGDINDIKSPPTLRINTNISGVLMSHQKNLEMSIVATDQGGGIDEIRLYQNSKLINSKTIEGEDNSLVANVTLVSEYNGKNFFKAVALSKDRTESKPVKLIITYTGSKDSKPDLYLLAVGINEYKNPKYKLNYANADAKAITEELNKDNDYLFGYKHITFIEDDRATKANILNAFEQIKNQISEQDVFIFYYAGHGVLSEGAMDDKDYYLIMHDVVNMYGDTKELNNKALSTSELKELSQNLNAQKQIFFMDACQSGGAIELLAHRGVVEEKAIAQLARATGTFWLAASESEQYATEFEALGHGIFTYSILEGLSGKADTGKDGIITVKELSMFLEETVPNLSAKYKGKRQYPLSYGFGQDFPLILNDK